MANWAHFYMFNTRLATDKLVLMARMRFSLDRCEFSALERAFIVNLLPLEK